MPVSGSLPVPCGLGSLADVGRHERRINAYRKRNERSVVHSHSALAALNEECQQQTEKLRDKLAPVKVKKKQRAESRHKESASPASSSSPSSGSVAVTSAVNMSPLDRVLATNTSSATSTVVAAGGSCGARVSSASESAPATLKRGRQTDSGGPAKMPKVELELDGDAAAATSAGVRRATVKHEPVPAPSSTVDDLFGELSGDIDYEHVLRMLSSGDGADNSGHGGAASAGVEIPDIGDLSRIIEGAESGADAAAAVTVGAPACGEAVTVTAASSMLRTMAERLSTTGSSSSTAPPSSSSCATSSVAALDNSRATVSHVFSPCGQQVTSTAAPMMTGVGESCDVTAASAAVGADGAPKLTMQQRLKLKRQMMAEEFRQSHFRQQQQQQQTGELKPEFQQPVSMSTMHASLDPSVSIQQQQQQQQQQHMQMMFHLQQQQQHMMSPHVTPARAVDPTPSFSTLQSADGSCHMNRYPMTGGHMPASCSRMIMRPAMCMPPVMHAHHHHHQLHVQSHQLQMQHHHHHHEQQMFVVQQQQHVGGALPGRQHPMFRPAVPAPLTDADTQPHLPHHQPLNVKREFH